MAQMPNGGDSVYSVATPGCFFPRPFRVGDAVTGTPRASPAGAAVPPAALRWANLMRFRPKWENIPSPPTTHAMYGNSQLGLRPTWRTVVVSLGSKLLW